MNIYQDPKDIAKSHLAVMLQAAASDGVLDTHEAIFIQTLALKMGLNNIEFKQVMETYEKAKIVVPNSLLKRKELFFQVVALIHIDTILTEEEIELCQELGGRFDLEAEKVNNLLKLLGTKKGERINYGAASHLL